VLNHLNIEKTTTTQRVTSALRGEMLAGRLPPGTQVSEVSVSQSLGISRNTLREAVQQLEYEGLLSWKGNRRIVTVPSLEDVRDVYRVRLLLETGGIEASRHGRPEEMAALQLAFDGFVAAVEAHDEITIVEQNTAFHAATVAFMRSPRLNAAFESAMTYMRLALIITDQDLNDQSEQIGIHAEILECVRTGKIAHCLKLLRRNYAQAEKDVLHSLSRYHRRADAEGA
jgi:DNA-binding GntR family transcriptional regulator